MFMFVFLEHWCVTLLFSQRHFYYFLMGFITTGFISLLMFSVTFQNYAYLTLQEISSEEVVFKPEMARFVQNPLLSHYFLCSRRILLPYPGTWGVSCLLGGLRSSASVQWMFYRSSSTCRCISDVSVGRKVISASYSSAILPRPPQKDSLS